MIFSYRGVDFYEQEKLTPLMVKEIKSFFKERGPWTFRWSIIPFKRGPLLYMFEESMEVNEEGVEVFKLTVRLKDDPENEDETFEFSGSCVFSGFDATLFMGYRKNQEREDRIVRLLQKGPGYM